jgi:deaminated glutathione amidase
MKRIALAQMNSSDQLPKNLDQALLLVEEAAAFGVALIAFPETFLFIGGRKDIFSIAEEIPGNITSIFREMALKHKISILLGSIIEKSPDTSEKFYNTSVLINNMGEITGQYRKIHLFDIELPQYQFYESDYYLPGSKIITCDHEIAKIGMTICYDLRFPSLFAKLADNGAQLIFVPAAFTLETGKDHWIALLRARAIENQVYIAAPAQFGKHQGNRSTFGNSVIIDPWGTVLCQAPYKTGLIYADIDLEYLNQTRAHMPIYQHKVKKIDN